jgi:hypothetical protein
MTEEAKEDIQKAVAERGRRFTELEKEAKAISREIDERKTRISEIAVLQDRELYAIQALEALLPENERWTQWHRTNKKDGDPLSLATMITQVLEINRKGLPVRNIHAEICKLGWRSDSKKPQAMVLTTLHRRKDLFTYLKNKTWCLKKYAPDPMQNVVQFKAL